jgi:predicted AAA+ superfamily ATPase
MSFEDERPRLKVGLFANKKVYFADPKFYTFLCGKKARWLRIFLKPAGLSTRFSKESNIDRVPMHELGCGTYPTQFL